MFGKIPDALLWGLVAALLGAPVLLAVAHRLPDMLARGWEQASPGPGDVSFCPWISVFWLNILLVLGTVFCNIAVLYAWGLTGSGISAMFFCAILLVLARIDAACGLLPDVLTLPLLWLGMLFHMAGGWLELSASVAGAASAYMLLWIIFTGYRCKTGRDGMGYGDFKLAAALGAWLGVQTIPFFLLCACLPAALVGVWAQYAAGARRETGLPFGPFLALAGILILFWDFAPRA